MLKEREADKFYELRTSYFSSVGFFLDFSASLIAG